MLFTVGFVERRLRAVAWAAIVVASAFVADFPWRLDWEPFYRSDDYESLPQTPPLVLIALPIRMAAIESSARSLTSDGPAPARATRPWRRGRRR